MQIGKMVMLDRIEWQSMAKMEKHVEFPGWKFNHFFLSRFFLIAKILLMFNRFPGITSSHIFPLQREWHMSTGYIYTYTQEVSSFNKKQRSETII